MDTICHTPGVILSTAAAISILSKVRSSFLPYPATSYVSPETVMRCAVGSSGSGWSETCKKRKK